MHIADVLARRKPTMSLEFFPPKTPPGWDRLFRVISKFEALGPDFVSVTYGAGGSTRSSTHELVRRIKTETGVEPVPHLTCVCHSSEDVDEVLGQYAELGVGGVMALGGDAPRDGLEDCQREFMHAIELVRHISDFNRSKRHPHARGFGVGVAGFPEGHPATPNRTLEMDYLKAKVDAGADYVCTQLFFENRDFLDFRDRCLAAGIVVPIVAGIMPIVSRANYERIPSLALGSRYPATLIRLLQGVDDDDEVRKIGTDWAREQCTDLARNDVDGIHFYTLNRFGPVRDVWDAVRP
jgi:methylenetetrahydrofolate reductase (NADH)